MTTPSTGTVRLHRVLRAPPERVYKAFVDPKAMVKWLPPHGFTGEIHSMDARVGGAAQDVLAALAHHADARRIDAQVMGDAAAGEFRDGQQQGAAPGQQAMQQAVPGPELPGIALGRVEHPGVMDHHGLPAAGQQRRGIAEVQQETAMQVPRQVQLFPHLPAAPARPLRGHARKGRVGRSSRQA